MKGLLKNLGLILILVGAVILVACSFTGNVNNNAILGTSAVLIVIGLISYILINKRIFTGKRLRFRVISRWRSRIQGFPEE